MKRYSKHTVLMILLFVYAIASSAQTIRIEDIKKNFSKKEWFKVSGGVSASGTYYAASEMYGHLPWTFMIQGNVDFKIFNLIDLPFSFNITNSGFTYAYPNMPNRFSLHPSYKWAAVFFLQKTTRTLLNGNRTALASPRSRILRQTWKLVLLFSKRSGFTLNMRSAFWRVTYASQTTPP